MKTPLRCLIMTAVGVALFAVPAGAHVTANPDEGPAGAFFKTDLRVGHGCEGTPTVAVRVQIPAGVTSVKPQPLPGWDIEISSGEVEPYELHGETFTEAVTEVAWVGGELPDEHMQEFGLSMRLPEADEEALYFPVVQECQQGEHRWIEIPDSLDRWGELEEPAPFVRLTAGGGHGAEEDAATAASAGGTGEDDEPQPVAAGAGGSDALSIIAVLVALAALGVALWPRVAARRSGRTDEGR